VKGKESERVARERAEVMETQGEGGWDPARKGFLQGQYCVYI